MQYFEDVVVGQARDTASHTFTEAAIIRFAEQFDPQPFHIDPEAAKQSNFGGLIASGWHTASTVMRLIVDAAVEVESSLGSPGFDNLVWKQPVRPGDTIRCRLTCQEKTPSRSRPDIGSGRFLIEVFNQRDELIMSMVSIGLMRYRHPPQG